MILIHSTIEKLKNLPGYPKAKAGDPIAAHECILAVFKPEKLRAILQAHPRAIIVPVHAEERNGRNALPIALAYEIGVLGGNPVNVEIVQANRTYHTGATAMHRLKVMPEFDGPVIRGAQYILVDDVVTSGSTLAGLRRHIQNGGGTVVAMVAVAASGNPQTGWGGHLTIRSQTLDELEDKFGLDALSGLLSAHEIAKDVLELTNSQAKYVATFKTLNSFRNSLLAAECTSCAAHHQGA